MNRIARIGLICSAALAIAGCDQAPTGQVAAVVGDEEITLQEVNGELSTMQLPESMDPELARNIALQRVIDRRLLAKVARDEGLDQTPEFFIRQRQLIDTMLVNQLREKLERAVTVPSDAEIENFATENPAAFAERSLLQVDMIRFPPTADREKLSALEDDHSMDEVAQTLQSLGIQFDRRDAEMDSAMLGQQRMEQIRSLPAGEPFILPGPQLMTVAVIKSERPAGRDSSGMTSQIADQLKRGELAELLQSRLDNAKETTNVQYQSGFEPVSPDSVTGTETGSEGEAEAAVETAE